MAQYVNTEDDRVVSRASHDDGMGLYKTLTWLALILSVIALLIAWAAYDRTGEALEDRIKQGVEQSLQATGDAAQDAADAVDAGPDGVDEDDTDVQPTN